MQAAAPLVAAMHPMEPDHVHEEIELQLPDFSSYTLEWVARAPQWRDYYLAHDQTPHYAYMKTVLQILQWYRPRERWVLKSPQHLEQLGPLLATFPDATVVVTHRDPVAVVQSTITMACYGARTAYRTPRPEWYRDYWTERIGVLLDASLRDRHLLPEDRTVDVYFDEYMADEMGTLERVYRGAGMELTEPGPGRGRRLPTGATREAGRARSSTTCVATSPPRPRRCAPASGRYLDRFPVRIGGGMSIAEQVDHLIDTRPGRELLRPVYDDPAPPGGRGDLPLRRLHRGLHAADRQRAGHRQHRHGLRGAAPPARLRRHPARPDPLHRHDAGSRRPSRRGRPVQGEPGTRLRRPGEQPGLPGRRRPHPQPAHAHGRHLVRHAGHGRPPHRQGEPGRLDAAVRTGARRHRGRAALARLRRPGRSS